VKTTRTLFLACVAASSLALGAWLFFGKISPGEQKSAEPWVAAVVSGQPITMEDLDRPIAARIFELEEQIYRLRKQRLNQMVAQILLQKEAQRQGLTQQKLVDEHVLAGGVEVTQEEIDEYCKNNQHVVSEWKGTREELRKQVSEQLGRQKGYRKVLDFAASLEARYGVSVHLREPAAPMASVAAGDDPALGPASAPITIVEFSDYQCSACGQAHETGKKIRELHPGRIHWVFKDYPMRQSSRIAAEAARCANEQGRFWEYQDLLFSEKEDLTPEKLTGYARLLNLDMEAFTGCRETRKYQDEVRKNIEEGSRIGVNATPTYLVNGRMISGGPPIEEFQKIISRELAKSDDDKGREYAKGTVRQ